VKPSPFKAAVDRGGEPLAASAVAGHIMEYEPSEKFVMF
jgi:hypothetical protein